MAKREVKYSFGLVLRKKKKEKQIRKKTTILSIGPFIVYSLSFHPVQEFWKVGGIIARYDHLSNTVIYWRQLFRLISSFHVASTNRPFCYFSGLMLTTESTHTSQMPLTHTRNWLLKFVQPNPKLISII